MQKQLINFFLNGNIKRKFTFILFDLIAFCISLVSAFYIRFEFEFSYVQFTNLFYYLALFLTIKFSVFAFYHLYDISWRYVSLQDLASIAKASAISSGIIFIILYGFELNKFEGFPRTVILLDLMLTFILSSGFRISKRMFLEVFRKDAGTSGLKRTIIIGAGSSGEQLLRELYRNQPKKFIPVGFIDDDLNKQNLQLQGVRVIGTTEDLPYLIHQQKIEVIIIAIPSADRNFYKKIFMIAKDANVSEVKVVSTINDISNVIQVSVRDIRDLNASDLIGRHAISINTIDIIKYIKRKRVLITGAAGSIGSEIARQVIFYDPDIVGILDINESDLADLEVQLGRNSKAIPIKMYLADISDMQKVDKIIREFAPDVIFHAAAYKHVPVMEKFPEEAIRVNVLGTNNLAISAKKYHVENFVLISTDKAVNPTSIMGATKRVAENIVTGIGKGGGSNFVSVRFGNVIGSRGSALPIFLEQLKHGGPITITHPDMKRYFMTIPEAVALVLQAAATGKNGDVFVLDMGEPIKILDIAKELILMNNLIPDKDIKIEFTGIREGEKLFEEVLTAEEGVLSTRHEKIFKAKLNCTFDETTVAMMIDDFSSINTTLTKDEWRSMLKKFVPTFDWKNGNGNGKHSGNGKYLNEINGKARKTVEENAGFF
ncbi:MAG TPA: nucleoside-diphosphate sugar epimerase/dehydratase [Ignavibacteriaceae bacterium]|nr:nucleoside-diphosphate sugar epimerase/dehydratase [Ignavibacteriaceae bacterium]